jgi:hypothetical protein
MELSDKVFDAAARRIEVSRMAGKLYSLLSLTTAFIFFALAFLDAGWNAHSVFVDAHTPGHRELGLIAGGLAWRMLSLIIPLGMEFRREIRK